ncbi:DUF6255 family natural product biosynthesis protein [Streptomyces huiliensis]|uniref:DUF6255 family natural product biosynthesis protein n=1 Tax=Streptomyces huiliensis TaxID=2876027 RepID=UPI001CBB5B12|nr:DUF6255 family natural product biosynthesis protein [Streptomyces huiliensis]MBZ4322139.1 hypothetical protein [Streptomyces huiliensis]
MRLQSIGPRGGPRTPHRFCGHPPSAWTTADGMRTCGACGTRRVDDYAALALALELPERPGPFGPTSRGRGAMAAVRPGGGPAPGGGSAAARRAELLRRVREANRWSAERRP